MRINRVVTIESTHTQTEEEVVAVRKHVDKCIQTIYSIGDKMGQTCTRSCQFDLNDIQEIDESTINEQQKDKIIGEDGKEVEREIEKGGKDDSYETKTIEEIDKENFKNAIHYKCPKCHKCLVCGEIKKLKEAQLLQQQLQQQQKEKEKEEEEESIDKGVNPSSISKTTIESNDDTFTIATTTNASRGDSGIGSGVQIHGMNISPEHIACECISTLVQENNRYFSMSQLEKRQGPVTMLHKENIRFLSEHQMDIPNLQGNVNIEVGRNSSSAPFHKYDEVKENGIDNFSCDSILVVSPETDRAITTEDKESNLKNGSIKLKGTSLKDEVKISRSEPKISFNIPVHSSNLKNSVIPEEYNKERNSEDEEEEDDDDDEMEGKRDFYEDNRYIDDINNDGGFTSEIDLKDDHKINSSYPNIAYSRSTTSGTANSGRSRHHSRGSSRGSKKKKIRVKKAKSVMLSTTKSSRKITPPSDPEHYKSQQLAKMKEFRSTPILNTQKKKTRKGSSLKQQSNGVSLRDLRPSHDKSNNRPTSASRKSIKK